MRALRYRWQRPFGTNLACCLLDLPEDGRRYEIHQGDRLDRVKSFGEGPWQVS